jgi:succinate dehydrogenase / fumarate reductase membrane anchor subunit
MRYLTDRKRAVGMGSARTGTHHFWDMKLSSVALLFLVPVFVFYIAPMLGEPYDEVMTFFAQPFPAIVTALTLVVGFKHFRDGAQVMIEDYVHGTAQKISIILLTCLCYGAAATGVFAVARLAL